MRPVKKQEIIIHIQEETQLNKTVSRRNQMLDLADKKSESGYKYVQRMKGN